MIKVPEQFAEWRTRVGGPSGRRWVRSLPAVVERLRERWDLVVEATEPLYGGQSLVVLVRRGEQPLALRLTWLEDSVADEACALRAWRGRGVVTLVDAAPEAGGLLLERLDHTRSLHTLPLPEAAEVAGSLIRTLAVAPPAGLRTLSDVAAGIPDTLTRRQQALGFPIPPRWVEAACRHALEWGQAGEQVLIHADLHYGNVLAATRQPWLAVDPRALCGAPEYSVPELMWTRADELPTDADVRRILDIVVAAGELDAEAAHGWTVTRCVDYWLWGLEHGLTIDPARCERILSALARR
ncbi:aminoglycoside phosphotransferase family protein [Catellatospora citrea]|uniref:Aminoglycoside O-phosphotransferase n=1 Tax=Catellatospora citrea TaxID=53366 RepID=A0A8J3KRR1_9ACTN|nr:aminoglycoside phosphotransferase family protein [Catellatospora citrea]RKE12270.1 streptomycin 6-kinase [Catellatospora citrea]GIG00775.1 aminoglycoside O-phosphotransferase [Catellatospora citrea]